MGIVVDTDCFDFIFLSVGECVRQNLKEYFPESYVWARRESKRKEDRQILRTV